MANKSYIELLKDPRWQKKRLEILNRDDFCCIACYNTEATLHVHHLKYIQGKMPWEYDNRFLVTLCEMCHEGQKNNDLRLAFAEAGILETDAVNLAAFVKFIAPEFVTNNIFTPQGIWSMIMFVIREKGLNPEEFVKFLYKFKKGLR